MSQAFRLIWLCEGPKGYFRGLTPALIQVGPFTGLNLAMFNYFKRSFDNVGKLVGWFNICIQSMVTVYNCVIKFAVRYEAT